MSPALYRGRIAPSPTGFLHLGHARTFWVAHERARLAGGRLIMRMDDLDGPRCRQEYVDAACEDLRWLGLDWDEGPDCGGDFGPYTQSERESSYREAMLKLVRLGDAYPCYCSRKDIQQAASAPHESDDELIYPGTCRPQERTPLSVEDWADFEARLNLPLAGRKPCWRFRGAIGACVKFTDVRLGAQKYSVDEVLGDFVVWRRDGLASYQIACVVDDSAMAVTEVVRGEDLLISTARQLLLFNSVGLSSAPSAWCHCTLMNDELGKRLAKRYDSLGLRHLRGAGADPGNWISAWQEEFCDILG